MDRLDVALLEALQKNSNLSVNDLSEIVALSPSACHRRMKALENSGIISRYAAELNPEKIGLTLDVFVEISLSAQSQAALNAFEQAVQDFDEILECHLMGGQADYRLRVAARDVADFDEIHRHCLSRLPGVSAMHSNFAIRVIKPWSGYPVRRMLG